MIAPRIQIDVRRPAELGEHDDQRAVEHAAFGQIRHRANERSNSPSCSMWKLKFSLCVS